MKRDYLKVFVAATVTSLIGGGASLPAQAHCHHHSMHSCHIHSSHMHHSWSHHHSSTHLSMWHHSQQIYEEAVSREELELLESRINLLDRELTDSLGKITQFQDLQFSDANNSMKYESDIANERQKIDKDEAELAEALEQQKDLNSKINQRVEQIPSSGVKTLSPYSDAGSAR